MWHDLLVGMACVTPWALIKIYGENHPERTIWESETKHFENIDKYNDLPRR